MSGVIKTAELLLNYGMSILLIHQEVSQLLSRESYYPLQTVVIPGIPWYWGHTWMISIVWILVMS